MPPASLTLHVKLSDLEPFRDTLFAAAALVQTILGGLPDADHTRPALALRDAINKLGSPYHQSLHGKSAIHFWFGLSYANYLVLPRTLLQQMDVGWQERFVRCLEEFYAQDWDIDLPHAYQVKGVNEEGRYVKDTMPHYRRGFVARKLPQEAV